MSKLGSDYCRLFVLTLNYGQLLANICYHCHYWFAKKIILFAIIVPGLKTLIIAIIRMLFFAIIDLCYQLFVLLQLMELFSIIVHY
jgi:hypothetical protein